MFQGEGLTLDNNRIVTLKHAGGDLIVLDGIQYSHGSQLAKMSKAIYRAMCTGQNSEVDLGEYPM